MLRWFIKPFRFRVEGLGTCVTTQEKSGPYKDEGPWRKVTVFSCWFGRVTRLSCTGGFSRFGVPIPPVIDHERLEGICSMTVRNAPHANMPYP